VKTRPRLAFLTFGIVIAIAASGYAHHGFDFCTPQNQLALRGKVVSLDWKNPHAALRIEVRDRNDAPTVWSFELGSLNILQSSGWRKDSLKAGDEITIKGYQCGGPNSMRGAASEVIFAGKKLLSNTHSP
jgi:hypothetical protein